MARGWESKSVESQIEEAESRTTRGAKPRLTPEEVDVLRRRESLELSRRRVERDLAASRNSRYKAVLASALADLDARLAELDPKKP